MIGPHKESHYDFLGDEVNHHDVAVIIPVPIVAGFITSLSRKEKDLFSILYGRKGEFVSRTELSRVLWKKDASNSTLTQLSQLIGRLKRKMVSFGVDENSVITHWNKGYALSISICNTVTKYIDEKVIQDFVAAN
ncbi:helix-turn-helix domain-containing protein [Enterococcus sp. LJL120]